MGMAIDPEEIKNLREEILLAEGALTAIGTTIEGNLNNQLRQASDAVKAIGNSFSRDLTRAIKTSSNSAREQDKIINKIKKGIDASNDIAKETTRLENERQTIIRKVEQLKRNGIAVDAEKILELESQLDANQEILKALQEQNDEIQESVGLTGNLAEGLGGVLQKLGFGQKTAGLLSKGIEQAKAEGTGLGGAIKNVTGNLLDAVKPVDLLVAGLTFLVDALLKVDSTTGNVAKNLGMSYDQANAMVTDMTNIANLSGETYINTENLVNAQLELSKALGTNAMLSEELLSDFAQLTKQAGFTNESMVELGKITQSTGGDLSDNTAEILGTAKAFNAVNKLALNEKSIVEEVAKTSSSTVLTLGRSAKALAENVLQAKKFGINLKEAEDISSNLLQFQSSIESEMEAELLTGKSLNLEQARFLALQGKTGEAAAEVLKQVGSAAEFGNMNVIQQEALAKAVGMTKDQLASSLIEREAIAKLSDVEGKTAKEKFENLVKQVGEEEAIARLGDEQLANQLKSQSVQDRLAATTQKLQEIFVSIAEPILAIVSPLMDLVTTVLPLINILLQPIVATFQFIANIVSSIVGFMTQSADMIAASAVGAGTVLAIKKRTFLLDKGKAALDVANQARQKVSTAIESKGLLKSIAGLAINAAKAVAGIPVVGPLIAAAAAASAYALGKKYFSKADDLMSPGYGKRVLSAPEGTFALNDKDTIVAGTDLDQGSTTSQASTINVAPLVAQMTQMNNTLNAILAKEGTVTLDGTKVGTALTVASSQLQ